MSDTTPHPDETPSDPTAPPPPPPVADEAPAAPAAPPASAAPPGFPAPPEYPAQLPPTAYGQQPPPQYTQQPPPQYSPAQAPLTPSEERTWGMLSHVVGGAAMVLSGGFLGFVGSLVIYLMYKDRGPFVRAHSANSLNVQITAAIGFLIGWLLTITIIGAIIGIPILIAVFVWAVVVHILGAVKANNGEWWTPPMTPQFIK